MCEYYSDVLRNITKGDIYTGDFGEMTGLSTIGGIRPLVVLQSDDLNCMVSKSFLVAPIRSDGTKDLTEEEANKHAEFRRKHGKVLLPISIKKGKYSFIDFTQIRQMDALKLDKYIGSIAKPELRIKIDQMIMQVFFTNKDIENVLQNNAANECQESFEYTEEEYKEPSFEMEEEPVVELKPIENTSEIGQKINNAISEAAKANEQKVVDMYKMVKRKEISKSTAARKLGLTIKAFDEITKQLNKEEKEEKKTKSTYSSRPLPKTLPQGFSMYAKARKEGKMTIKQIANKLGKSEQTVYNYLARYEQLQKENKVVTLM